LKPIHSATKPRLPTNPKELTPEQQFIVACIRRSLKLSLTDSSALLPGRSIDWEQSLKVINRHGLVPLVFAGLPSEPTMPASVTRELKAGYVGETVRLEMWLEPNLRRILDALESERLEPIVIKGAALAYVAYPKPVYRTFSDIDLWLPPIQIDRARDVLVQLGLWTRSEIQHVDHHLPVLYVQDGQVGVELHYRLLKNPHPYAVNDENFRARSQFATIAGAKVRVLSPTDALHYNCIHLAYAHRYRWYPLRSLVDILAITTKSADHLDWDLLVNTVRLARTAGAVYWPLWLSRTYLGAPVPETVLASLAPSSVVRRAVAATFDSEYFWDDTSPAARDALNQTLVQVSLHTGCSTIKQARVLLRCIFPPPDAVGHLPAEVTGSRLRYALHSIHPARAVHALHSVGRLTGRRSRRAPEQDSPPVRRLMTYTATRDNREGSGRLDLNEKEKLT
jgi:hypothetical protein